MFSNNAKGSIRHETYLLRQIKIRDSVTIFTYGGERIKVLIPKHIT